MKKACVACGKQIPDTALDCVFCSAKQPAPAVPDPLVAEAEPVETSRSTVTHQTDPTLMGVKLADVEAALEAKAQAAAASATEPGASAAGPAVNGAPAEAPSGSGAEPSDPPAAIESAPVVPPQARDTAAVPLYDPDEPQAPRERTPGPRRGAAATDDAQPWAGLGRLIMGVGGLVLITLFYLPWHGVGSWQLLETLSGVDFARQLFYLTGGVVLLVASILPLPFLFRAALGAGVAALPVLLGAGGVMQGWRGLVAGLAILGLPASHLLRSREQESPQARALVILAIGAVVVLYLVPVSAVVPLALVAKMIFSGSLIKAVLGLFILVPLGFAGLSLLGVMGRDLSDVSVLLSVLVLLWAPVVVALRGFLLEDGTQLYVALALLWASATAALSIAQLLSLAARARGASFSAGR